MKVTYTIWFDERNHNTVTQELKWFHKDLQHQFDEALELARLREELANAGEEASDDHG